MRLLPALWPPVALNVGGLAACVAADRRQLGFSLKSSRTLTGSVQENLTEEAFVSWGAPLKRWTVENLLQKVSAVHSQLTTPEEDGSTRIRISWFHFCTVGGSGQVTVKLPESHLWSSPRLRSGTSCVCSFSCSRHLTLTNLSWNPQIFWTTKTVISEGHLVSGVLLVKSGSIKQKWVQLFLSWLLSWDYLESKLHQECEDHTDF